MKKRYFSLDDIKTLDEIFEFKKWSKETSNSSSKNIYDCFASRCGMFAEKKDRDFLLELTKRYLWVSEFDYEKIFMKGITQFVNKINLSEFDKVYVIPVKKRSDINKRKSGDIISEFFNKDITRNNPILKKIKFEVSWYDNLPLSSSFFYLVVDDYVGSGSTVRGFLNEFLSINKSFTKNVLHVFTLVAQRDGFERLKKDGIAIFSEIICNKGISDFYSEKELSSKIKQMESIETRLGVKKEYRFGYCKSEALVTMRRTPNNTFPFYWFNGCRDDAPFVMISDNGR